MHLLAQAMPFNRQMRRLQFDRLGYVVGQLIEAANGLEIVSDQW